MTRSPALLFAPLFLACCPALAAERPEALAARLGDDAYAAREAAFHALVAAGDPALPALEAAAKAKDPEVRWRAQAAMEMIRRRVSPELKRRIGDALDGYGARPWYERERIAADVAAVGGKAAVPALERLLSRDPSEAVQRTAAIGLLRMGPEGLLALERCGAKRTGLPVGSAALRIQIGNGFLEEDQPERALAEYRKAVQAEPKNEIAWYNIACALARLRRIDDAVDALRKAVQFGYDDLEWMQKDTDLDNLRAHDGYKQLVKELEQKAAPQRNEPGDD